MEVNLAKRPRTMFHGVINDTSQVMHWKIPDFFSIPVEEDDCLESPRFTFAGCKWKLRVYPKGDQVPEHMSVFLLMDETSAVVRTILFTVAMKIEDGLEEKIDSARQTFKEGKTSWGWYKYLSKLDVLHLMTRMPPSGALIFTCHLEREAPTPEEALSNILEEQFQRRTLVGLDTLSSDFKTLLSNDVKCDVTIDVQGKEYRAHRAVLAARSSVFRAMYEHDTSEAKSGALEIPDCEPETFGDFLGFLYTGRLEMKADLSSFFDAYHLYATADKYDVQELKSFCSDYLQRNLTKENFSEIVQLADQRGDDTLMSFAQMFFNKNFLEIFLVSNWQAIVKNDPGLANKLLEDMASANLKRS